MHKIGAEVSVYTFSSKKKAIVEAIVKVNAKTGYIVTYTTAKHTVAITDDQLQVICEIHQEDIQKLADALTILQVMSNKQEEQK